MLLGVRSNGARLGLTPGLGSGEVYVGDVGVGIGIGDRVCVGVEAGGRDAE
jgi:hypothetical protein